MNLGILGQGLCGIGAGVSTDPAAQAWANQVVTNGGTVSAPRLALVSTMIAGLKTDNGVWPLIDRFFILAAENAPSALTDMAGLALAVVTGSPTRTVDRGYIATLAGDIINDTSYDYSTATNFKQNSSHLQSYINQSAGTTVNTVSGSTNAAGLIGTFAQFTDNKLYIAINNSAPSGFVVAGAVGCSIGSRTGANTNIIYKSGTSIGTDPSVSSAVPSQTLTILKTGSTSADVTNRIAAFCCGGGLSSGQVVSLTNRITTFLTAIGAQ
jgi:hypothetical protein